MTDIEELSAKILAETRGLAEDYAARFPGDPDGELRAWLRIAVRREAMVRSVYREAERADRMPAPRGAAGDVVWEALTLIWQQESVHTTLVEVKLRDGLLRDAVLSADLEAWQGAIEGRFLTALTGRLGLRQILSRLALHFGALVTPDAVPAFARELSELDLREFFLLCSVLEATARQSYERMTALAAILAEPLARRIPSVQLRALTDELRRTTLDEAFHEAAFREIAGWVKAGAIDPERDAHACAKRLLDLLPRPANAERRGMVTPVLTDGGLGPLFRRHNLQYEIEIA